jgi:3-isopropylmalate dehydrogenase
VSAAPQPQGAARGQGAPSQAKPDGVAHGQAGAGRAYKVMLLPGDGVGPEIVAAAQTVLAAAGERFGFAIAYKDGVIGGCAIDKFGAAMEPGLIERCAQCDAVLLGAVGGPKWDTTDPRKPRPEQGLLDMRKGLELFANLRPVKSFAALAHNSTLRPEVIGGVDLVIVRELTGGVYFGERRRFADAAYDTMYYTEAEVERLVEYAFRLAAGRRRLLHSIDKANVLESSRLWRAVAQRVAGRHPDVEMRNMLVDNCAMQLVREPRQFDVVCTENLFGDILSDEAGMLTGSIGMLPSASVGAGGVSLYEPIHGSAPDIAGRGIVNPCATVLSAAMMLDLSFGEGAAARDVEAAVEAALAGGARTADIAAEGETAISTEEMTARIARALQEGTLSPST